MREYRFTIAEDDPVARRFLRRTVAFAFPECHISTFSNAEDALAHILNGETDVLLTDNAMGSMTGAELIRQLRERGFQIPIIMISSGPDAAELAREAGANDFLDKPADPKTLAQHLHNLIPA